MPTNPSPSKVERLDVGDIDEDLQKAIQNMDEIQNHLDQLTEKVNSSVHFWLLKAMLPCAPRHF